MSEIHGARKLTTLKSAEEIASRVRDLAREINRDLGGQELVVVGVLRGAVIFMSDLVRHLQMPLTCDFIRVSSYGEGQESSGRVQLEVDLTQPVAGKHVLVVEDIVDTGLTMQYLRQNLAARHPASVRVCTMLHKPEVSAGVQLDYVGFAIPNRFVVGYGLDLAEQYRNLPYIAVVED